jgi:exopolyphosphatase / guanosine-5'-triphosphate,3'-diphosphate pyrophosphatase
MVGGMSTMGAFSAVGPCAAVDVGSNSVRLLVVDAHGHRLTRTLATTRLATGVDRTGRFDDDALARTLDALAEARRTWEALGADRRVAIAATSAVRDAVDRGRFLDGAAQVTGVPPAVLSGDDEAALAFEGATNGLAAPRPVAVVDVGGGSTELVVGDAAGTVLGAVSMQLGCVRITERHLAHDPPTRRECDAAATDVDAVVDAATRRLAERGIDVRATTTLVAVAGTATTLAALHLGLDRYEEERIHGTDLPVDALEDLRDRLLAMPSSGRAHLGPMQPGRADVIHGGAVVLAAVARRVGVTHVRVSERDGLDALAERVRAAHRAPDVPPAQGLRDRTRPQHAAGPTA